MKPVVVVGGYGQLGLRCVEELLRKTAHPLVIAGPSVQRAEATAVSLGPRVQGVYLDASDPRTLRDTPAGIQAWVVCCPGLSIALLDHAVDTATPLISMAQAPLPPSALASLSERAWDAETPLLLHAGWAPGLPGVLAEQLARTHDALDEIRVASTGPWLGTSAAREDWHRLLSEWKHVDKPSSHRRLLQFGFPDPVGARRVIRVPQLDLASFSEQNTVRFVSYYEQDRGLLARGYRKLTRRDDGDFAVLAAEAFENPEAREPAARLTLRGDDPRQISAWLAVALVERARLGKLPAGVSALREAVNPGQLLQELDAAGAAVDFVRF